MFGLRRGGPGAAVIPQLRRLKARKEWNENSIYFGHLRYWDPQELAKRLQSREEAAESRRVDVSGRVGATTGHDGVNRWGKHSFLQLSMWLAPVGALLVFVSAL